MVDYRGIDDKNVPYVAKINAVNVKLPRKSRGTPKQLCHRLWQPPQ